MSLEVLVYCPNCAVYDKKGQMIRSAFPMTQYDRGISGIGHLLKSHALTQEDHPRYTLQIYVCELCHLRIPVHVPLPEEI